MTTNSATAPIGVGLKFKCSQEQGAFVFADQPADRTVLHKSKTFGRYMLNNIESWHEFASQPENDLDLRRDQILFVSGCVKTNDWGIGAFTNSGRAAELSFQTQLPFVTGSFSCGATAVIGGNTEVRTRPAEDSRNSPRSSFLLPAASGEGSSPTRSSMEGSSGHMNYPAGQKKDQCLFINYYKVKRRIWGLLKTIKAAAGPDNREPEDDDEDEGSVILSEESVVEELEMEEVRNPGLCR